MDIYGTAKLILDPSGNNIIFGGFVRDLVDPLKPYPKDIDVSVGRGSIGENNIAATKRLLSKYGSVTYTEEVSTRFYMKCFPLERIIFIPNNSDEEIIIEFVMEDAYTLLKNADFDVNSLYLIRSINNVACFNTPLDRAKDRIDNRVALAYKDRVRTARILRMKQKGYTVVFDRWDTL